MKNMLDSCCIHESCQTLPPLVFFFFVQFIFNFSKNKYEHKSESNLI